MQPENIDLVNPLRTRNDLRELVSEMLNAVTPYFKNNVSRIDLGNFTAHYGQHVAAMETFSRLLWGATPLLAGGDEPPQFAFYLQAIKHGTDPQHADYWGEVVPYDQQIVEMAAFGLLLSLAGDKVLAHFTPGEQENLWRWLKQSEDQAIPDNNWHFFPILVQVGFHHAGMPVNREALERHFAAMEHYYLGDGWYSDGPGRPRDYYISMGFHFYGLIYARLMADVDPTRCALLRQRSAQFATDFIHFFADDGSAIPFGRSLTYRFAQAAFWSAVAFSGLEVFSPGVVKGLVLRHLRWWLAQPIFDRDGILSVGYSYPNLVMAEDYNGPGSPYWGLKTMLVLALAEDDPFWQATELPLPTLADHHSIPLADQILVHQPGHLWMLTSGQLELNNFVNTEAKYCKFAYSSRYGFTCERGRYGLAHAAVDSTLLLAEKDNYWRGRRDCEQVVTSDETIYSRWRPWHDVVIDTWLLVLGTWQVRVHRIESARHLDTAEGDLACFTSRSCKPPTSQGAAG
ncbi:hypothetical protein EBL_c21060 [Shimwellia blattae DSM 4481 = NBRC 105725]|uniref:DUF2264 domain-containing protein n=1 Tax=Shimwellia blattae (strain ATCC 29907 / DSM 4481 / JCM 1650 / NBRC 105725 / CDC 9005-74) TaxID=630626 RepID=I2B9J3_SHIBC|nr:DUF2264 domain-containing protein [Shimwellia blattae]AFJ47197.1 hypothetical protein EBL_c21060 [Shimwellia blattae DSM 4481 = NBRC 105725]GAB82274.1 hypothetical protein EB105725_21_00720 [Shimwellia blattae DSM 4481 = NBRC 105725]VDY64685.1 Uncharacterized protein conserved in bacteria [Shimwellia blattae]VEC22789.1 Uncharacterized protein conserved in bacteria [Shimwellia blattae]